MRREITRSLGLGLSWTKELGFAMILRLTCPFYRFDRWHNNISGDFISSLHRQVLSLVELWNTEFRINRIMTCTLNKETSQGSHHANPREYSISGGFSHLPFGEYASKLRLVTYDIWRSRSMESLLVHM